MESFKNASRYTQAATAVYALLGVHQLISLFKYFSLWSLLWLAAYVCIAVCLFMGKRDIIAVAGFGVMGLIALFNLLDSGSFLSFLMNLLFLAANGGICLIAVVSLTEYLPQWKPLAEKFWYVPAAAAAVLAVFNLFSGLVNFLNWGYFSFPFWPIVRAAALLLAAIWAVFPDGLPADILSGIGSSQQTGGGTASGYGEAYFSLGLHIVLLLLTGGIWMYIWIYRVTRYLNCVRDEQERSPVAQLLLCMFVPFYSIYWTYKSAQRIDKLAAYRGIKSDLATLCLVLAIFIGIVPPILMQDKLNSIASLGSVPAASRPAPVLKAAEAETPVYRAPEVVNPSEAAAASDAAQITEKLKMYKELLDNGILTQEEFEARKKQLLDRM